MFKLNYFLKFIFFIACTTNAFSAQYINVGVPKYWGELVPSLQYTAIADFLMKHQFEPLVRIGKEGIIEPLAAKSWVISDDFKQIIFKIDTTRKFSNGTPLNSSHFKKTWEYGLTQSSKSHNKSVLDALYKIEGFDKFQKTKELSGVVTPDNETLIIKFHQPFRQALDRFSGGRYAAFIKIGETYLGTGPYVISKSLKNNQEIILDKNKFSLDSKNLLNFKVSVVDSELAEQSLIQGSIDIYEFAIDNNFKNCHSESGQITCMEGLDFLHYLINVNGLPGTFFSKPHLRLALQSLIYQTLSKKEALIKFSNGSFDLDFQFYLPFQKGRLAESEAYKIISEGLPYIDELKKSSKKNPIRIYGSKQDLWLIKLLEKEGLTFTEDSGEIPWEKSLELGYNTNKMDLLIGLKSIINGDPDGIYHAFGKNGSILFPSTFRDGVAELLEEGRSMTEIAHLDKHYQKVSRAMLREIPAIHLSFKKNYSFFRKDRVKINVSAKGFDQMRLNYYQIK